MKRKCVIKIALFLVVVLTSIAIPFIANATAATQQKLDNAKKKHEEISEKIDQKQEGLSDLEKESRSLKLELNGLNSNIEEIGDRLEDIEQKIIVKEAHIADTQLRLQEAKEKEQEQYAAMKQRIQMMYESGNTLYLELYLGAKSFSDFVSVNDYIEMITKYDRQMLIEYQEEKQRIAELESQLQDERAYLDELREEALDEKGRFMFLIQEVQSNLSIYQDQILKTEEEIEAYEKKQAALNEDIIALQKQLEEEIKLSKKAAGSTWRSIDEISFTEEDRYLLANLIYCEAGGEPYEGQVAVGAVVVNRVLSSVFPATITGVIYQNKQFSPVASGRLALALSQNRATESCYKAADEALSGYTNVGTCVFFRTIIPGLDGIFIGGHVFY